MDMYCYQTDISCIVILVLLLTQFRRTDLNKNFFNAFRALMLTVITVCVSDALIFMFDGRPGAVSGAVLNIASFLYYSFAGLASMLCTYFVYKASNIRIKRSVKAAGVTLGAALCVLSFLSMFYDIIFFVQDNVYMRGRFGRLHVVGSCIFLLVGIIVCIVKYCRTPSISERRVELARACIIVLPIIGAVFQTMYYGTLFIWPMTTLAILIIFLFTMRHELDFDGLTGLFRKDVYEKSADRIIRQCAKTALVTIDIDNFKSINDTYGHKQGDAFLTMTAEQLKISFPEYALIGRIGGDEFSVLIYRYESIASVEEKCAEFLKTAGLFMSDVARIDYSCSAGIAETEKGCSYQEAYRNSDKALYDSKRRGRNRCTVYDPENMIDDVKNIALIIDDVEINRVVLSSFFEGRCDILEAKDARSAIAIIKNYKSRISFILLSLTMPDAGRGLLDEIKRDSLYDTRRIVIHSLDGVRSEDAEELGVLGVIHKPYDADAALGMVKSLLA